MHPSKLDQIDHLAISVTDIAAAVTWYRERFQCDILYQDQTWAMLRFGNIKLAFVIPEQHPPHLAFITPNAENYGELKAHRDGTRSVYVTDPFGNQLEMMAPY